MKCMHVSVAVKDGDINKALKVFKKRCFQSGHLKQVKERATYVKPNIKRKLIKENAKRRQLNISMQDKLQR